MKACPDADTARLGLAWLLAGLALAGGGLGLLWVDHSLPQAGLCLLIVFSLTVGFVHGALDVLLLLVRFRPFAHALGLGLAYLLLVLLLGGLLSFAVPAALLVLLLSSLWHFGESYARWPNLPMKAQLLTRLVVGGAPVMAALLVQPAGMAALFSQWPQLAGAMPVWQSMAWIWLALVVVWALRWGWRHRQASRWVWLELGAVLLLNLGFSPLMAFALYFGLYHAPVHIWRIWRASERPGKGPRRLTAARTVGTTTGWLAVPAAIVLVSLLLGSGLWWLLGAQSGIAGIPAAPETALAMVLPWLVVSLAAVTLPHLMLISCCSTWLSGTSRQHGATAKNQ